MKTTRRSFLRTSTAVLAGAALSAPLMHAALPSLSDRKPNIVFILTDDQGWGDLHCYHPSQIRTPNLDKLAKQGTLFENFYVSSPICSPSRAGIMTGRFPASVGFRSAISSNPEANARRGNVPHLATDVPILSRTLQRHGYRTAHFGKWHLGDVGPSLDAFGFDVHQGFRCSPEEFPFTDFDNFRIEDLNRFRMESTQKIVDRSIDFIKDARARGKPFYVQVWDVLPHENLDPPEDELAAWKHVHAAGVERPNAQAIYYAAIARMDRELGRLIDFIDANGMAQDTIIIFSSDNGPPPVGRGAAGGAGSTGPFRGCKWSLYEGGIRTPFIIRWPGKTPAGVVDATSVVAGVDLYPTLCRLTGCPLPEGTQPDGEDISDVFFGRGHKRKNPLCFEWIFPQRTPPLNRSPALAIRDGQWKLMMNPDGSRIELYDLVNGPKEVDSVADTHPDVVKRLKQRLLGWHKAMPPYDHSPRAGDNPWPWPHDRATQQER